MAKFNALERLTNSLRSYDAGLFEMDIGEPETDKQPAFKPNPDDVRKLIEAVELLRQPEYDPKEVERLLK